MAEISDEQSKRKADYNAERNRTRGAREEFGEIDDPKIKEPTQVPIFRQMQEAPIKAEKEMQGIEKQAGQGQKLSRTKQMMLDRKRQAERKRQYALRKVQQKEAQVKRAKKKGGGPPPDEPNPLGLLPFVGFFMVAIIQDGLPPIFDLIGIGPIISYMLLPFTWGIYLYVIVRRVPKGLQRTFIGRTALITLCGWIPYVGEILPEWVATTIGGYWMLQRYRAGYGPVPGVPKEATDVASGQVGSKAKERSQRSKRSRQREKSLAGSRATVGAGAGAGGGGGGKGR